MKTDEEMREEALRVAIDSTTKLLGAEPIPLWMKIIDKLLLTMLLGSISAFVILCVVQMELPK